MLSVFIVIKDGTDRYYLPEVVQHGLDIYCIPPHLGVHYSLHESGEAHFRSEGKATEPGEEPPVALAEGEAGTPIVEVSYVRLLVVWVALLVFALLSTRLIR